MKWERKMVVENGRESKNLEKIGAEETRRDWMRKESGNEWKRMKEAGRETLDEKRIRG